MGLRIRRADKEDFIQLNSERETNAYFCGRGAEDLFCKCVEDNKFYEVEIGGWVEMMEHQSLEARLLKSGMVQSGQSQEVFLRMEEKGVREIHTYEFTKTVGESEREYFYLMIQYDSNIEEDKDIVSDEEIAPELILLEGKLSPWFTPDEYESWKDFVTNVKIFVMRNHGENKGKSVINGVERPLQTNVFSQMGAKGFYALDDNLLFDWKLKSNGTLMDCKYTYDRMVLAMQYLAEQHFQFRGRVRAPFGGSEFNRLQFVNYDTREAMLLDVDDSRIHLRGCKNVFSTLLPMEPTGEAGIRNTLIKLMQEYELINELKAMFDMEKLIGSLQKDCSEEEKQICLDNLKGILEAAGYTYHEGQGLYLSATGYSVVELYYDAECGDTLPTAFFYDSLGNMRPIIS